ncbi:DNA primase [Streptomyces sp. CA-132043]|uniref:DNA primase n=1 Tax=Streptomyces sp. CA-132043 TaxID=3240048 RepID=UPI003D927BE4
MNNRAALALAVAGGYALGRTKKMKLALSVGGMVLGRRLQLDPQRLLSLVDERLKADPQLSELRDQLRNDLSGVGRAAAGAFVNRRIDGLASSLHERTLGVQDRIAGGTLPQQRDDDAEQAPDREPEDADRTADDEAGATSRRRSAHRPGTARRASRASRPPARRPLPGAPRGPRRRAVRRP